VLSGRIGQLPPNAAGAYPGLYAKVGFAGADGTPVDGIAPGLAVGPISIPAAAVVERSEVTAVYVVAPDGRLSLRQVRLGRRQRDTVEVLAGLVAGERIAADPLAAAERYAADASARGAP